MHDLPADRQRDEDEYLRELFTPRIYITFHQDMTKCPLDAHNVARPAQATFGPYLDVVVTNETVDVASPALDMPAGCCDSFCLATRQSVGWKVHDGMDDSAPTYHWLRLHTSRTAYGLDEQSDR